MSVTAREAMGRDGIENPCHWLRISTPNGRGRWMNSVIEYAIISSATMAPRKTKSCRQRRTTTNVMIVPHRKARSAHRAERRARPSMRVVRGSNRNDAIQRRIAVSTCS